jgi:hypothetical protein
MPGGSKKHRREQAIAALLSEPTVEAAATTSGVSYRTLKGWLRQSAFRAAYLRARQEVLDGTISKVVSASVRAVDVLAAALDAPRISDRIKAAGLILQYATRSMPADSPERKTPNQVQVNVFERVAFFDKLFRNESDRDGRESAGRLPGTVGVEPVNQVQPHPLLSE